jgi:hypothetical protein
MSLVLVIMPRDDLGNEEMIFASDGRASKYENNQKV